ncbi:MAG: PAS domain-containing protein [Nitratireductor sp.]
MRHENTKKLFGYWNRIRAGRIAPERSEIEPSDIRDVLADTFILEISARLRTISFRLAGTRLCAAHGKELKSYGFLGLWAEEDSFEIAKAVSRVYCDFKPVLINSIARTGSNQFVEFETLLLPLQTTGEDNSRILGVSTPKTMPYWLGAEPVETHSCRGLRIMELPQETATLVPALGDLAPESDAKGPRKVAHLTIFDGGRH